MRVPQATSWLPHMPAIKDVFGRLHICINTAGVFSTKVFYEDKSWRKMIDVNLTAVIDSTSKAIHAIKKQGGLILNLASAAAFFPADLMAVYGASKAGVANFTRALAGVGMGIRVNALCPEFVDTLILVDLPSLLKDFINGNIGFVMEKVVTAAFSLLDDESMKGECLWVPPTDLHRSGLVRKAKESSNRSWKMGHLSLVDSDHLNNCLDIELLQARNDRLCEAQSISKMTSELILRLVVSFELNRFREICAFKVIVSTWHFKFQQNVTYKDFLHAL